MRHRPGPIQMPNLSSFFNFICMKVGLNTQLSKGHPWAAASPIKSSVLFFFFFPNFTFTFKNSDRFPSLTQQIEYVHLYFTLSTSSSFSRMVSWNNVAIISAQGTLQAVALLLAPYLGFRMAKVVMWGSWPSQSCRQEAKAVFFLVLPLSFLPGRSLSSSQTDTERLLEN